MILSEDYIKVPGKHYKVKVQCVSTRRLTTMEWLIVNCTAKFNTSWITGEQTLKDVFEDIFQLTNSEILIKPCIESLLKEQAIQLDVGPSFIYSSLQFSQIRLTAKGKRMAEDGLFPGATKELPLDIFYNPMTEKINQFVGGNEKADNPIEFGVPSDYSTDFPADKIIEALHKGMVGRGRFVASKLRIEGIDCLTSIDWDNVIKLEVSADSDGHITTQPSIKEEKVKPLLTKLFFTKELTSSKIEQLTWLKDTQPRNILGSGKRLKESFLDVCRNGNVLGVDYVAFQLYKKNTTAFKHKTVFIWGTKEFSINHSNESLFIGIPQEFKVMGCIAINEKNESVSFARNTYSYDDNEITVPIAFEDNSIRIGEHTLVEWLEEFIGNYYAEDLRYLALFSIPIFSSRDDKVVEFLRRRWEAKDPSSVTADLHVIANFCKELKTEMISLDEYGEELWSKYTSLDTSVILENMSEIMQLGCISVGSESQRVIMKHILSRTKAPKSYNELFVLLQSVGIKNHEDALLYDEVVNDLYTKELIIDTLKVIMEDKYTRLPELFELDAFFNEYVKAIKELEFLVYDLKMFVKYDSKKIGEAIENCPEIALVQSYTAEIISKNSDLLNREINVYNEMRNIDPQKAENFFDNLKLIKQIVHRMMISESQKVDTDDKTSIKTNEKLINKMFVVDTCALMHHPNLLLAFADNEYVRIPTKVIDELGKIKDKRSSKYDPELSRVAARLASDIENKYMKLFNQKDKMRLMIENAELDLLPEELDRKVPDNQILSVALKYKDWDTIIISDDGVFRLTTIAQNLRAITSDTFIEEHKNYLKSLEMWEKSFEKAGGTFKTDFAIRVSTDSKDNSVFDETNKDELLDNLKQTKFENPVVDEMPIRELKKYLSGYLTESVFSLLQNNGIKTVGQFKALTLKDAQELKARGKQTILRNNVIRALIKLNELHSKGASQDSKVGTNIEDTPVNEDEQD